jgi:hypothetical protein
MQWGPSMAERRDSGGLERGWRLDGTDGEGNPIGLVVGETALRRAYPGLGVGRHPQLCELVIDDPSVSRRHCRLSLSGDGLLIEDLNALNSTVLDDRVLAPFAPEPAGEGATLVLGQVTLCLTRLSG